MGRPADGAKQKVAVITKERTDTGLHRASALGEHLPCIEVFEEKMMVRVLLVQELLDSK